MKLHLFRHAPRRNAPAARGARRWALLSRLEGKHWRRIFILLGAALLILIIVLLSRAEPGAMNSAEIKTVQERGVLRVGVRNDMPNMAYNGEGMEIELADLLARRMLPDIPAGNSIRYVEVNAMNVDAKTADGQIDAVIALMPNSSTSGKYVYSQPYYEDKCYFITAVGTEKLVLQGISAGYVQNTPEESVLTRYVTERPSSNITMIKFASYPDMLTAIRHGRVDVALMTQLYIERYLNETALNPDSLIPYKLYSFRVSGVSPGAVQYAIAAPTDTPAIATVANLMLEDMKENGSLARLYEKYGLNLPDFLKEDE